jgi:serine/threonine-protein kinase
VFLPLLAELNRRRVFRALVGYGIAAFAVLQIIEPVMHGLHWPDQVLSYVVVALAAGFPIVVTFAWIFDVNAGRLERTRPAGASSGLRGTALALVLVGIGALAAAPGLVWYFFLRGGARPPAATARAPSIAVLPFVNLSGGQENEYFSDGVTEEIINALANVEGIRVVARTSAFSFKGKNLNVRQIGDELNVATVLEGSVRREGNQLRVIAQLIDAANGYHLMSKTWDREVKGVFSLEDELARAIVQALKPKLVQGAALVQRTTGSTEAHDLYLRGRYFWNQRTKEGMTRAVALFGQAITLDPSYALAHSGLADSYALSMDYAQARAADVLPKAKAHALKAVELDDALAEGHASLGIIGMYNYQWDVAERELKRAIELRSGYATAHHWYALVLSSNGRAQEASAEAEQARQLDPTSMIINNLGTLILSERGDCEGAIAQAAKTIELNPSAELPRLWLALTNMQAGRFAEALAALDKAPVPHSGLQPVRAELLASLGDRAAAQRLLANIEQRFAAEPVPRGGLAAAHLALGDKDRAFEWLERGVDERDQSVLGLKVSLRWASLRSEPRYHKLLRRMNLE